MYHGYSVSHEKFVWDARMEPGVIDAFSKIWGTSDLLVSFDGINITLPLPTSRRSPSGRWPHQDQDSRIRGFGCAQGIINLVDNGPEDGGLMVMKGSHKLNDEFFKTHSMEKKKEWGTVPDDWHGFDDNEVEWFEKRGCELMKVDCKAGDLVVWDSRTVHYNVLPTGKQTRAVICKFIDGEGSGYRLTWSVDACYTPAALATAEGLAKKKEIFENRERTVSGIPGFPERSKATELTDVDSLASSEFLESRQNPKTREGGSASPGSSFRGTRNLGEAVEASRRLAI